MFDLFQPTHLLFVLLVALVVSGPKRLAEVSRSLGRAIQSLQAYREEFEDELLNSTAVEEEAEKGHSPRKKG
jgi:TatA/E family protein of Tat protein translocase